MFVVHCGSGAQKIYWLSDVAIHRYDHFYGIDTGSAKGVRLENGVTLNMQDICNETLSDDMHVWVILKEDVALMEAQKLKKK